MTHVPSMYLSEMPGKHQGCREAAIQGHREIGRRCRELDVDTMVVLDVHWLVNAGYHINCNDRFEGCYTSNELPHFIKDMRYAYRGDPELGRRIAECANAAGVGTRAHEIGSLELEYGTLVPMRYERRRPFQGGVGGCLVRLAHAGGQPTLRRRAAPGDRAERQPCGGAGQRLAVASLQRQRQRRSHHARDQPGVLPAGGLRVVDLWRQGDWKTFCAMLPEYADLCVGEGGMHDTAMLLGLLGWDAYDQPAEIVTEYFASSGTGQLNAVFPVPA